MKKFIIIIIPLLSAFFVNDAGAACVPSGSNWITTPDYASVASCVSNATAGDTITVSAGTGTETWNSTLTITKGLTIIGPGSENLTITTSSSGKGIFFSPPVGTADVPFRLSGFHFIAGNCSYPLIWWGNENNEPTAINNNKFTQMRIDHNILYQGNCYGGKQEIPIYLWGTGYHGVIDHNTITGGTFCFRSTNNKLGGENWKYWPYYPGMEAYTMQGHGDSVYIENNILTTTDPSDGAVISSQGGHRYVVRYNTITTQKGSYSIFDAHGNYAGQYASTMGVEIYGNKLTTTGSSFWLAHRGGQAMVFGNTYNSATGNTQMNLYKDDYDINGPGPANHSVTGQPQHQWKSYYFLNRRNYTAPWTEVNIGRQFGGIPAANQDFWDEHDWVESSSGVGAGSSLPGGNCTEGVGFWLTNQSVTDLTDYVGASPTTPISGTLYICNASNTWVSYYTPFTYPHPLTTGKSLPPPPPLKVPNPPMNLQVN